MLDLWIYQEIIWEAGVEVVIEIAPAMATRRSGCPISGAVISIAEDGIVDVMEWTEHTSGPLVAAQQFASETDEFVIDRSREKFLLTCAPGGFLKRVRPPAKNL